MRRPRPTPLRRPSALLARSVSACVGIAVALGCTWEPIKLEGKPRAMEAVDAPVELKLGERLSDTLDCTSRVCSRRFRIVVSEPGKLTIAARASLEGPKELFAMTLESTHSGVLGGTSTDDDPGPTLRVSAEAKPGIYYLLVRGAGGRIPFEVGSRLEAGAGPAAAQPAPEGVAIAGSDLRPIATGYGASAAYDPNARFGSYETFAFVKPPAPQPGQAGQPLEQPVERQLRRAVAFDLERKGLVRGEPDSADLLIGISVGSQTSAWFGFPLPVYFDRWDAAGRNVGTHTYSQRALIIDVVDPKAEKLVWHGWTQKGLPPLEMRDDVINEAVAEVLEGFPPPY